MKEVKTEHEASQSLQFTEMALFDCLTVLGRDLHTLVCHVSDNTRNGQALNNTE